MNQYRGQEQGWSAVKVRTMSLHDLRRDSALNEAYMRGWNDRGQRDLIVLHHTKKPNKMQPTPKPSIATTPPATAPQMARVLAPSRLQVGKLLLSPTNLLPIVDCRGTLQNSTESDHSWTLGENTGTPPSQLTTSKCTISDKEAQANKMFNPKRAWWKVQTTHKFKRQEKPWTRKDNVYTTSLEDTMAELTLNEEMVRSPQNSRVSSTIKYESNGEACQMFAAPLSSPWGGQ